MGTDDYRLDIPEGHFLKEAYIARAIASADALITLSRFKGPAAGVFGGSLKNLVSAPSRKRASSMSIWVATPGIALPGRPYSTLRTARDFRERRTGNFLEQICPPGPFHVTENSIEWDREKCYDCRTCLGAMSGRGIFELTSENFLGLNAGIAMPVSILSTWWERVR